MGEVEKATMQVFAGTLAYIFALWLSHPKFDLSDVEKEAIPGVAWHYLGILYFLAHTNCKLGEVEKKMLQVVTVPFAHFRHLAIPK